MTYKDHFVVEVKCKGKILRVKDDVVYLPFGSEYSLYLKNLNSKRAAVKVSIDGQDVLDNSSLIVDSNSISEIEGFLRGNVAKNKFKFIQKTKEIQEYRGDRIDDGIIRVEFAFEKTVQKVQILREHNYHHHYYWNYENWFTGNSADNNIRGIHNNVSSMDPQSVTYSSSNVTLDSLGVKSFNQPLAEEGITVKGSECNQNFMYSTIGELEEPEVIIIRLKGMSETSNFVQQPITVKTKLVCPTCGRMSKSSNKYCPNCGTFLE